MILAASLLAPATRNLTDGTLFSAVIAERGALKTIDTAEQARRVAFSPDGQRVVTLGSRGVRV